MPLPVVTIVGRPNVGKSSLFNWLAGRRISIVDPTAGVTRDRIATVMQVGKRFCELVDTGGIGVVDVDNLSAHVEHQIQLAIDEADLILFVVDVRDGRTALDQDVAQRLRDVGKPVIFVANKADTDKITQNAADFYKFGYGEPVCVSAQQLRGKEELLEAILHKLPRDTGAKPPGEVALKLAIVGRRNVGKSTFINTLADEDRVIVSEIAGTTRDSIDVNFERDGKSFLAIDTAGVRKKQKLANDIEYYSMTRAERSIRRADIVFHFFDPRYRISRVDKQLAEYILVQNKPAIFVVNKWDLMKDKIPTEKMANYIRTIFSMLEHVPIAFITATKGKNVLRLLQLAIQLQKQAGFRAGTGDLNRVLKAAYEANQPPVRHNRLGKIYYATQVSTHPPTIVLMTNDPELFDNTYIRYLTKILRDSFPFSEVAITLILRENGESTKVKPGKREEDDSFDLIPDEEKIPGVGDDTEELLNFADDPAAAPKPAKKPERHRNRIVPELVEDEKPPEPPKKTEAAKKPKKKRETKPWDF
jgi:GTP-binding protein